MTNWKLAPVRAVALLAFAGACGETANAPAQQDAVESEHLALVCAAFADMSEAALRAAYGADNLSDQTLPGPEGESYQATVLYPGDPARRLEIVWQDPETRMRPGSLSVSGEGSVWTGPNGLSIGADLADIERINGAPFRLWGFGWDYGGWVSDWNGGAFADASNCATRVRFQASVADNDAQGDSEFSSDAEAVRRAAPRVAEFGLLFGAPD